MPHLRCSNSRIRDFRELGVRNFTKWTIAAMGGALLASCSTTPTMVRAPAAPALAKRELPYRWSQGAAPKAHEDAVALFGPLYMRPGEFKWSAQIPQAGETKVVIDTLTQLFYVYRGDRLVGVATISSGKKGRSTPLGFWAVMNKKVKGYSRKYDNAPMPYMQMYDSAGIAFHAGPNPGYPASHGCVRLPLKFAERLYGLTNIGTKVIIEG
jgi:lipoprotein-anchoring transpeptidase ErfK/SrfK